MEFTKGNWELFKTESICEVQIKKTLISICAVNKNVDEYLYNALLISKAPEMLEMLKELRQIFDKYSVCFESQFFKYKEPIEQLIKEATEIK